MKQIQVTVMPHMAFSTLYKGAERLDQFLDWSIDKEVSRDNIMGALATKEPGWYTIIDASGQGALVGVQSAAPHTQVIAYWIDPAIGNIDRIQKGHTAMQVSLLTYGVEFTPQEVFEKRKWLPKTADARKIYQGKNLFEVGTWFASYSVMGDSLRETDGIDPHVDKLEFDQLFYLNEDRHLISIMGGYKYTLGQGAEIIEAVGKDRMIGSRKYLVIPDEIVPEILDRILEAFNRLPFPDWNHLDQIHDYWREHRRVVEIDFPDDDEGREPTN